MALSDWTYYIVTQEGGPSPSDISVFLDAGSPLVDTRSLAVVDAGEPLLAAFAIRPNSDTFDVGLSHGKIRTILQKKTGNGFRDSGIYFLSNHLDPTGEGARCYFLDICDGATNIKLRKAENGLLDCSEISTLQVFSDSILIPISNTADPVVCEVEWISGLFIPVLGGTQITVRFWQGSIDFEDMVSLPPFLDTVDPLSVSNSEGLYARSRSAIEPLDALFDNTRISKFDITP
jgi:hypothetical protein